MTAHESRPEELRRLRPFQSVLLVGSASGLVVAFAIWSLLAAFGLARNEVLLWLGTACGVAVLIRAALRVAVEAGEHEIVVTNIWRTHRVPWASVASIDDAGIFWPGAAALLYVFTPLRIRTRDGRKVFIQASTYDFARVADYLRHSSSHSGSIRWGFRFD